MTSSVALCSYNGIKFLSKQLESILEQQTPVDEIIISDDGSNDGTQELLLEFQEKYEIIRVFFNEKNLGAKKNFEQTISKCSGDVIFLSDQDDIWLPSKVTTTLDFFDSHPEAEAIFSNAWLMDEHGQAISATLWESIHFESSGANTSLFDNYLLYQLLNPALVTGATMAIRKVAIKTATPLYMPLHYWHDYWLGLFFSSRKSLYAINENLMYFREHSKQQTGTMRDQPRMGQLFRKAWTGPWDYNIEGDFLAHLAHAVTRLQLFSPPLLQHGSNEKYITHTKMILVNRLSIAKRSFLSGIPWLPRKKKLLGHWLKGGEYLQISFTDLLSI